MNKRTVAILIPIWNDWNSAHRLWNELESVSGTLLEWEFSIFFIDDGSTQRAPYFFSANQEHIKRSHILTLQKNFGHQRALQIGLNFLLRRWPEPFECFLLMDGDGQDSPSHIPALFRAFLKAPNRIVAAVRNKRSESLFFRIGYLFYRASFFWATGKQIRFGNFILLPNACARSLIEWPETGVHLAANVLKLNLPVTEVPLKRGVRYEGESRMGSLALFKHGLRAIGVFAEEAFRRARWVSMVATGAFLLFAIILYLENLPLWGGLFLIFSLQTIFFHVLLLFMELILHKNPMPPAGTDLLQVKTAMSLEKGIASLTTSSSEDQKAESPQKRILQLLP